jgi:hypothetical protein
MNKTMKAAALALFVMLVGLAGMNGVVTWDLFFDNFIVRQFIRSIGVTFFFLFFAIWLYVKFS